MRGSAWAVSSSRRSGKAVSPGRTRSLSTASFMRVSGVRKSCEMPASNTVRAVSSSHTGYAMRLTLRLRLANSAGPRSGSGGGSRPSPTTAVASASACRGWAMPLFRNIAGSEATHTEAVRTLLERYNLPDPAANLGPGVYQNATLLSPYAQLVAAGSASLVARLRVGAMIEALDIVDLSNQLKDVDNPDIALVYQNLMKGSCDHLRSFCKTLQPLGAPCAPKDLCLADFAAIVNSPIER